MTGYYLTNTKVEVFIESSWLDISADLIDSVDCEWGFGATGRLDRVSDVGTLKFTLRNDSGNMGGVEGYFTPNTANCKVGWRKNIPVRLTLNYCCDEKVKFLGTIDSIYPDPRNKKVTVEAVDFVNNFLNFPLRLPTLNFDKDISGVVQLILQGMSKQPQNVVYGTGSDVFPVIFDSVEKNTRVLSEFAKLTTSELGYIYLRHNPETLVVEGRHTRSSNRTVTRIPFNGNFYLAETGDSFITESGERLMLSDTQAILFDDQSIENINVRYGEGLNNKIAMKIYPRKYDASPVVLWGLTSPIKLDPMTIKTVYGKFSDPGNRKNKIGAKDVISPISTTDYLMFQNSNGTGTNLTANLLVTYTIGAEGIEYELQNLSGTTVGYVTKLQVRGTGIYSFDTIYFETKDDASISENGYNELMLDMKYNYSLNTAESISSYILEQDKNPKLTIDSIEFVANINEAVMLGVVYLDIGDLIYLRETKTNTDGYYYIHNIKFKIMPGGLIKYSIKVVKDLSLQDNFWVLGVSQLGINTVIGY